MPAGTQTERLTLAPWRHAADGEGFRAVTADARVMEFLGGPATAGDSDAVSQRIEEHWEDYGFGLWSVRDAPAGPTLGFVGLTHPLWLPGWEARTEIGWRLHSDVWGRGYATEAARAALSQGFGGLGRAEIVSLIHPVNAASIGVARKLSMTEVERIDHPSRPHELVVFERRRT